MILLKDNDVEEELFSAWLAAVSPGHYLHFLKKHNYYIAIHLAFLNDNCELTFTHFH